MARLPCRARPQRLIHLADGAYDENEAELTLPPQSVTSLSSFFSYVRRVQLACLFGRYDDALSLSDKCEAVVRFAAGFTQLADHYLYRGLAAAVALTGPDADAAKPRRTLRHCLKRLHVFATNCSHNFQQHESLAAGRSGAG